MRKYLFCFSLVLALLLTFPPAYSSLIPPQTYFIAKIVDKDTGAMIDPPAHLKVTERFEDSTIRSYALSIGTNPAKFNVAWVVPNYMENTIVEIIALKDGYRQSEPFVYNITKQSSTTGELFDHTFTLETENIMAQGPSRFVEKIHFDNNEYPIEIITASNLKAVSLDQPLKKIIFNLEGSDKASANITMPKTLIDGPFMINRDGLVLHSARVTENATHSSIYLEYDAGAHTIEITGSSIIPEFPSSLYIITTIAIAVVIIMTVVNRRLTGKSPLNHLP